PDLTLPLLAGLFTLYLSGTAVVADAQTPAWMGYGRDAQHTAISPFASQPLKNIHWQTPVDLSPQYSGNDLFIHYGSPVITQANTVILPLKTGATGGFAVEGLSGQNGAVKWTQASDYILPPHKWVPSYGPTLTPT